MDFFVNDGIDSDFYLDEEYHMRLPTIDLMERKILKLGQGAYMYKTDLSRGYRQLRVDPYDWPLLGFMYNDKYYMDICPPFGLRSAAMMMQRTTEAVSFIHRIKGHESFPYIDDFGGAELSCSKSLFELRILQQVLSELGLVEAINKVCEPTQTMIWLGIMFNTMNMTMSIPKEKLDTIISDHYSWHNHTHATKHEMQSIIGSLQFVAKVSPPVRLFVNRMLDCMKDTPKFGSHSLSWGFKKDVDFFLELLPQINGVKILDKSQLVAKECIQLDACLTGCGAWCGTQYYGRTFPQHVTDAKHSIAHLEILNIVVAVKLWAKDWAGHRIDIRTDNTNTCIVIMNGKSIDPFMQACAREIYMVVAAHDIELNVIHTPGVELQLADALSREHTDLKYANIVNRSVDIENAERVHPNDDLFNIDNTW